MTLYLVSVGEQVLLTTLVQHPVSIANMANQSPSPMCRSDVLTNSHESSCDRSVFAVDNGSDSSTDHLTPY